MESGRQTEVLLLLLSFLSSSVVCPFMHFSFKNWAHSVIYLCVCKVWRIINCSWTSEALQNLTTKNKSGFWMHAFWVFFFFFLLPPRGPREGRCLCRWSGRIWQPVPSRAYCAAPVLLPRPRERGIRAVRPSGASWMNLSWHTESCILCLPGPETPTPLPSFPGDSAVGELRCLGALLWANGGKIPPNSRLFHRPPDLRSLGILYSASLVSHEVSLLLTLLLLFAFAQPFLQPWLLLGLLLHSCVVPTGESHSPQGKHGVFSSGLSHVAF